MRGLWRGPCCADESGVRQSLFESTPCRLTLLLLALAGMTACTGPPMQERLSTGVIGPAARAAAAATAASMIGTSYRYGGASAAGFDCSGLVVYSYAKAGIRTLPHSAARLEQRSQTVALSNLEPGDLLFFRMSGRKTSHVGIYVGDRAFVHAPSSGKRVERVSFDHVYWGPRIRRAGRLTDL